MNTRLSRQRWTPYLFIAPFFVVFATFMVYPLATSVWLSLHQSRGFQYQVFVGGENFARLFRDPVFWKSVRNTFTFAAGTFLVQLPLALVLATSSAWRSSRPSSWLGCSSPSSSASRTTRARAS